VAFDIPECTESTPAASMVVTANEHLRNFARISCASRGVQ
jgi:hypothetical protein